MNVVKQVIAGTEAASPLFLFDLAGRVRNLSLPASSSSLVPLFEAVSNSLHAIEARFEDRSGQEGTISIEVLRGSDDESEVTGFLIKDNGIGLTEHNMRSFLTSDSTYKLRRGGKGVGRLTWLKIFQNAQIISVFKMNEELQKRSFEFSLAQANPIRQIRVAVRRIGGSDGDNGAP